METVMTTSKSTGRQPRKWTVAEDQKLREEVEAQMIEGEVKDWCRIAAKLPGRTNKDCRKRWHNSVAGGLKKGQWSKSEDIQLARGVQQYGQRWTLVANCVGSRSADQCAKRWQQSLDPELDRSEWRDQEDKILIEAVQNLGRHWKDIQRHHFQGRSKNCIKNRYTVLVRRYQNQGITLPSGASTPEPATPTNRMSAYSHTDETFSYSSNMYDDILRSPPQVSAPETHHSWSLDEESFPSWSSHESFNLSSTTSEFSYAQQQQHANASHASPWGWTTTSMDPPHMMHMAPPNTSPTIPNALNPTLATYDSYSPVQAMLSPNSAHFPTAGNRTSFPGMSARAPTSSPRPRASTGEPYRNPNTMSNAYMRPGMHHNPSYQF